MSGREYRSMTISVVKNSDSEKMLVEGYAATFNQPYTLYDSRYYKVIEQIAPTAFDECDMTDVIMQYDHAGRVFARNKNGTLSVGTDNTGLKISADLGGTDIGRQLYQEIRGGYPFILARKGTGLSCSFSVQPNSSRTEMVLELNGTEYGKKTATIDGQTITYLGPV